MKATNFTRGTVLAGRVKTASSFAKRLVGLIGTADFPSGMGLLLVPCSSIHTWFMKYPIDVLFLDRNDRVLEAVQSVPPFRLGPVVRGAAKVLELPAGVIVAAGTQTGDLIEFTFEE